MYIFSALNLSKKSLIESLPLVLLLLLLFSALELLFNWDLSVADVSFGESGSQPI